MELDARQMIPDEYLPEGAKLLEPRELYDQCIVGTTTDGVIYSRSQLTFVLMEDFAPDYPDPEELQTVVIEHIDYNIEGSKFSEGGWIIMDDEVFVEESHHDKLNSIFNMQMALNDFTFHKQGLKNPENSQTITSEMLMIQGNAPEIGANTLTNEWLKKYSWALGDEVRELNDELLDKWWSKDYLNMQNIRVELIDMLHFWVSLCVTAGMSSDKVFDIYQQKYQVNIDRQKNGYNQSEKTEADNESIK